MRTYTSRQGDTPKTVADALGLTVEEVLAQTGGFSVPGDRTKMNAGFTFKSDKPLTDFTDTEATRFNGLPGKPEVWHESETGKVYMVYFVPGTKPPVPLLYHVPSWEQLETFFGDKEPAFDRDLTRAQIAQAGGVPFGTTDTIPLTEGDPWAGFVEKMDRAAKVQPWLADPEVWGIVAGAWLEGRAPEQFEFEGTEWWQTHNEAQRQWMWTSMRDPVQAAQIRDDNFITLQRQFGALGTTAPDNLIEYMANQWTQGNWSRGYLEEQLAAVSGDPSSKPLDAGLSKFLNTNNIDVADPALATNVVRNLFDTWLGPAHPPTDSQINEWAGQVRRNGQAAQDQLTNYLRSQRMALFPEYADENLTYQDIAQPWRGFSANIWGQAPDETSSMFQQIVRLNDETEAGKLLRREGLAQGIGKVRQDTLAGLQTQTPMVQRAIR